MKIQHSEPYADLRRAAYPAVTEQLDAVFKLATALASRGMELPPDVLAWMQACQAVKDRYPKPQ